MPTFNFTIKPKGLRKQAIISNTKQAKLAIEEAVKSIVPTVFDIDYSTKRVSGEVVAFGEIIEGFIDKPVTTPFKQISDYLLASFIRLDNKPARLLAHIVSILKWNSNIVLLDLNSLAHISVSKRVLLSAIITLEKMNLIKRTTYSNTYVINHNEMFFGDRKQFIKEYNQLYEGKQAVVNEKGKIIL